MNDKNLKKCVLKVFNFVKKFKFLKIREFCFKNPQNLFFLVLKCKQKEHVHNFNSRWARSAQKPSMKDWTFCQKLKFTLSFNPFP